MHFQAETVFKTALMLRCKKPSQALIKNEFPLPRQHMKILQLYDFQFNITRIWK